MRVTKKKADKARKVVEQAKEEKKIIDAWDQAAKAFPDQEIEAITINGDGTIRAECVVAPPVDQSKTAQKPIDLKPTG